MNEVMFCQHCGKEISKDAEICPKCGVRVKRMDKKNVGIAVVLSLLFIGFGQFYNEQVGKGIAFIAIAFVLILTIFIGIGIILYPLFYMYSIYDAYNIAKKINAGEIVKV